MQPLEVGYIATRPSAGRSNEFVERAPEIGSDEKLRQLIDDPMGLRRWSDHDPDCAWCAGYRRSIEFGLARTTANIPNRAIAGAGVHTPHGRVAAALDPAIVRAAATQALDEPGVLEEVRGRIGVWSGNADAGGGAAVSGRAPVFDRARDRVRDLAFRFVAGVVASVQG